MTTSPGLLLNGTSWSPVKPKTAGNEYNAAYTLSVPLSRRFEFKLTAPFIAANARPNGPAGRATSAT